MDDLNEPEIDSYKSPVFNLKHRTYNFSKEIVMFSGSLKVDKIYYSILDQLIRSGTSIGANVVEGSSGSSINDIIKFYNIALKSANETKYWLCLIRDTLSTDKMKINELLKEADELSKIIAASIISLKSKRK